MIKIAIIMPCYYMDNFVRRALERLKEQTKRDCLVIYLINDCSPYTKCEYQNIIQEYSKYFEIKYFKTEKNSGPGVARQLALDNVTEDYVFFHDDDDYLYDESVIERLYEIIIKNPEAILVRGERKEFYNGVETGYETVMIAGSLVKKSFLDKYNIRFHESLHIGEDFLFYYQLDYWYTINGLPSIDIGYPVYIHAVENNRHTLTNHPLKPKCKLPPSHYVRLAIETILYNYEMLKFYKERKELLDIHKITIFNVMSNLFNSFDKILSTLEWYGLQEYFPQKEEYYDKCLFLIELLNKNKHILNADIKENSFKDDEALMESIHYSPHSWDEFYESFNKRWKNLTKN